MAGELDVHPVLAALAGLGGRHRGRRRPRREAAEVLPQERLGPGVVDVAHQRPDGVAGRVVRPVEGLGLRPRQPIQVRHPADRRHPVRVRPEGGQEKLLVQPQGRLYEQLLLAAFGAHPYRVSTVGWMSDLDRLTRPQAEAFHRTYYAPGNAVGALVGDVDKARAEALLRKYFGGLPAGPPPPAVPTTEPRQSGEHRVNVELAGHPRGAAASRRGAGDRARDPEGAQRARGLVPLPAAQQHGARLRAVALRDPDRRLEGADRLLRRGQAGDPGAGPGGRAARLRPL